ncbi:ligase-associated DNA damage response endonuclease PdeM [Gramella sp. AN32]|uniref:Ligase-associated DNA damage response endonuclease PdeM n=1 Tax=Christiangramia antarctica TaxID=2058158 RepID=A0ABW5X3I5_9FLAO|nr:ligase-associated DNA damage response endonuclease PdeM [Gramella sp. AN32]MCM4155145.1 ligase-associated DNA damage response endonuclease PdeM [Gramella sp. AN32]
MNLNIRIQNHDFVLHPLGVVYWPEEEILLVADVHLGKISHFRKFGSAVPAGAIAQNFKKLDVIRKDFDPEHIVFLGDLFHSSLNLEWDIFADWYHSIDNQVHLVAGNHDIISPLKYEMLGISMFSELRIGEFRLTHHPEETDGFFNICGHVHPGYKMRGFGRQLLKLPCFYKKSNQLILPAFGEFTGNYFLQPEIEHRIFAITGKEVILVS